MGVSALTSALAKLPPAPYALALSGGADSVALVRLLLQYRPDLHLHVVHLDHETRGADSTADAAFVEQLAREHNLPFTIRRRREIEPHLNSKPANKSALFRALRHALFRQVIAQHALQAVLLAHHADDQAETILHRLLRGSGPNGLAGMSYQATLSGLVLLRPLLDIRRTQLRNFLEEIGQSWREDLSNTSPSYLRNRLHHSCKPLPRSPTSYWASLTPAPTSAPGPAVPPLSCPPCSQPPPFRLPSILALESARRWLLSAGLSPSDCSPAAIDRLITMAADAASSPRQQFPGPLRVTRKRGVISAILPNSAPRV